MLDEEKTILIEKLFTGKLSETEQFKFEKLLGEDPEFREEVKLQHVLVKGIGAHGKELLRSELAGVYTSVKPDIQNQKYKPTHGTNVIGKVIKWMFSLGTIASVAVLIYNNRSYLTRLQEPEQMHFARQDSITHHANRKATHNTHIDTVWHTVYVHSAKGKAGDTVDVYRPPPRPVEQNSRGNK